MYAVAAITLFVGGAAVTGPAAAGALGLIFYLAPHDEDDGRHGARAYDAQNYNCGYHSNTSRKTLQNAVICGICAARPAYRAPPHIGSRSMLPKLPQSKKSDYQQTYLINYQRYHVCDHKLE